MSIASFSSDFRNLLDIQAMASLELSKVLFPSENPLVWSRFMLVIVKDPMTDVCANLTEQMGKLFQTSDD